MKNYDLYILDFDGTLFDTRDSMPVIFKKGLAAIGKDVDEELGKQLMHYSLPDSFKILGITDKEEQWKAYMAILEALDSPEVLAMTHPFPETQTVLDSLLEEGKKIAIASSNSAEHIALALQIHKMEKYGQVIVGSTENKRPKPYPDLLLECLKACHWENKETAVYIGDSLQDMLCAKSAGIDGILLERHGEYPDYEETKIDTLLELL